MTTETVYPSEIERLWDLAIQAEAEPLPAETRSDESWRRSGSPVPNWPAESGRPSLTERPLAAKFGDRLPDSIACSACPKSLWILDAQAVRSGAPRCYCRVMHLVTVDLAESPSSWPIDCDQIYLLSEEE